MSSDRRYGKSGWSRQTRGSKKGQWNVFKEVMLKCVENICGLEEMWKVGKRGWECDYWKEKVSPDVAAEKRRTNLSEV